MNSSETKSAIPRDYSLQNLISDFIKNNPVPGDPSQTETSRGTIVVWDLDVYGVFSSSSAPSSTSGQMVVKSDSFTRFYHFEGKIREEEVKFGAQRSWTQEYPSEEKPKGEPRVSIDRWGTGGYWFLKESTSS
ncbi:MAG: hypothetical protein CMH63_01405 [Nanoarchaeota archaeon]|jgi:hypothetical protein|nr:hypothetical protein [Nanoarchaeota archaeon]|tara:strand:- start:62229 stop:62627 length:399 start_codon:yes stop_codon:yes gene_type:complete